MFRRLLLFAKFSLFTFIKSARIHNDGRTTKILHVCLDTVNAICYCCHAFSHVRCCQCVCVAGIQKKKEKTHAFIFPLCGYFFFFSSFLPSFFHRALFHFVIYRYNGVFKYLATLKCDCERISCQYFTLRLHILCEALFSVRICFVCQLFFFSFSLSLFLSRFGWYLR